MKEAIERAVIDSNYVLKGWIESKQHLMTYEMVRGLMMHYLRRAFTSSGDNWRDAKRLLLSKSLVIDADVHKGFIRSVKLIKSAEDGSHGSQLASIFDSFDYELLNVKAESRRPIRYQELREVSLNNLQQFKF